MIYIVSGYMRCGTSMMMQALSSGGLTPAFDPKRDEIAERCSDSSYRANPGGLFEISFEDYERPDFEKCYSGKLVKVFSWGLPLLAKFDRKIVFMQRNKEEIRQSLEAMFYQNQHKPTVDIKDAPPDALCLQYRDVVSSPLKAFSYLRSLGWPIEPRECARVVAPNLYRFRIERLAAGA